MAKAELCGVGVRWVGYDGKHWSNGYTVQRSVDAGGQVFL